MQTELHTPTIRDAKELTALLVGAFPAIEAVLLCGSVARGDANPWSDIDLVVTSSDPNLTVAELRKVISERNHVSLIYYRTPSFEMLYRRSPLFIAHLKKEGVVLFDPKSVLRRILDSPTITKADIAEEIKMHLAKLAPYRHPARYNNNFLFCLSHLYSIGKGVIMLRLASCGILEFNRDAAFGRFATLNPDLAEQVAKVARLRPFYRLVSGRKPEPLPFSYHHALVEMEEAVNAIESLAERATCL
ncbi:MAG TPA: nucleotidyltransferase domain-containing protein [Candidatus Angelobacter sp.]|nr:nucleotidyltransferase domain-containing protein [Candidatus Angelobacter sp.]